MKNLPWHSKAVLALTAFLPVFLVLSALGTKLGLWGWQIGLLALTMGGGFILVVALALIAVLSLVLVLLKKPRDNTRAGRCAARAGGGRGNRDRVCFGRIDRGGQSDPRCRH
jgi:predicted lipid-binding transport protein (Tim44 family)